MSSNVITVIGNIVRDPELRITPNGSATITISVAVNRKFLGKSGEAIETVSYFNVVAWGSLAENVASSLRKGARVVVTGRLEQRNWEAVLPGGETTRRVGYELVADEIGASMRFHTLQVSKPVRVAPERIDIVEPAPCEPGGVSDGRAEGSDDAARDLVGAGVGAQDCDPF